MDVFIAEAKNHLTELVRAVEAGNEVVITRHGKPVAQIAPPPPEHRRVKLGAVRNRIRFEPGWNDAIDLKRFLTVEGDEGQVARE